MKRSLLSLVLPAFSALLLGAQSSYTGDGGRGMRLAVPVPAGTGLSKEEAALPLYIQGMLTDKFKRFSAMAIIDRRNLAKAEAERRLSPVLRRRRTGWAPSRGRLFPAALSVPPCGTTYRPARPGRG